MIHENLPVYQVQGGFAAFGKTFRYSGPMLGKNRDRESIRLARKAAEQHAREVIDALQAQKGAEPLTRREILDGMVHVPDTRTREERVAEGTAQAIAEQRERERRDAERNPYRELLNMPKTLSATKPEARARLEREADAFDAELAAKRAKAERDKDPDVLRMRENADAAFEVRRRSRNATPEEVKRRKELLDLALRDDTSTADYWRLEAEATEAEYARLDSIASDKARTAAASADNARAARAEADQRRPEQQP